MGFLTVEPIGLGAGWKSINGGTGPKTLQLLNLQSPTQLIGLLRGVGGIQGVPGGSLKIPYMFPKVPQSSLKRNPINWKTWSRRSGRWFLLVSTVIPLKADMTMETNSGWSGYIGDYINYPVIYRDYI